MSTETSEDRQRKDQEAKEKERKDQEARAKLLNNSPDPLDSVPKSVAVMRCAESWVRAQREQAAKGTDSSVTREVANNAYRMAMPPLVGLRNISDFIACVTFGVLIGAIKSKDSTKLLYAAQVALAAQKAQPKIE